MKIGIITLYDAPNYGAYWQAKALENYIGKKLGYEVCFIKTNARNDKIEILRRIYNFRKHCDLRVLFLEIKKIMLFKKEQKKFNVVKNNNTLDLQAYIFGSDEIWNFASKRNRKKSIFWGEGLEKNRYKISYAPSINSTSIEMIKSHKSAEYLKMFDAISVRDMYSKETLEEVLEKEVVVVLDPTLLVDNEFFFLKEKKGLINEEIILIYSYGENFDKNLIIQIQEEAKKYKCKLLSIGMYFEWCDYNLCCTPEEFLGYVHQAKMVITDTFHGSVFSMIYKKNVSIILGKNRKVIEFVKQMGLEKFVYKNKFKVCNNFMDEWQNAYNSLNKYKVQSQEYLSCLEKIENAKIE